MGFPSERSVGWGPKPVSIGKRKKRKAKKRASAPKVEAPAPPPVEELEEIPEEERSHVPQDRFKMVCGVKRIGLEKALIVLENPTCPDCDAVLKKREKDAELMRELLGKNESGVEW